MRKKFFEVCFVGTLNLCLKVPEQMQKTRNQFDHTRLRKRQKLSKIGQIQILQFFCSFWAFSQPRVLSLISTLLHFVRHVETQV